MKEARKGHAVVDRKKAEDAPKVEVRSLLWGSLAKTCLKKH